MDDASMGPPFESLTRSPSLARRPSGPRRVGEDLGAGQGLTYNEDDRRYGVSRRTFPAGVRAYPRGPVVCPLPYGADLLRHVGGRDDRQQGRARGRSSLHAAALSALYVGGLWRVLSARAL